MDAIVGYSSSDDEGEEPLALVTDEKLDTDKDNEQSRVAARVPEQPHNAPESSDGHSKQKHKKSKDKERKKDKKKKLRQQRIRGLPSAGALLSKAAPEIFGDGEPVQSIQTDPVGTTYNKVAPPKVESAEEVSPAWEQQRNQLQSLGFSRAHTRPKTKLPVSAAATSDAVATDTTSEVKTSILPPQLARKRANVSTEDVSSWTSARKIAEMKRRKLAAAHGLAVNANAADNPRKE